MPHYSFLIEVNNIGKGYVEADSLEHAKQLIESEEWDDICDESLCSYGKIIEIKED